MDRVTAEFVAEYIGQATAKMRMSREALLDFCEKISLEYGAKMRAVVKESEEVSTCQ